MRYLAGIFFGGVLAAQFPACGSLFLSAWSKLYTFFLQTLPVVQTKLAALVVQNIPG